MCGICAIISNKKNDDHCNQLSMMVESLKHRGPDNNGIWVSLNKKILLGHTRLSIIDLDKRLEDVYILYTTTSQTQAVSLLNYYEIEYIYFSERAQENYNLKELQYIDEKCFKKVFENEKVDIYKSLCVIEEK